MRIEERVYEGVDGSAGSQEKEREVKNTWNLSPRVSQSQGGSFS